MKLATRSFLVVSTATVLTVSTAASPRPDAILLVAPGPITTHVATTALQREVPQPVTELGGSVVSIRAGATRWEGFFVDKGLVVTSSTALAGRSVVQLVAGAGREGLGQVVATDRAARLAVLRVHADLSPPVFIDAVRLADRLPSTAYVVRHGESTAPVVTSVVLGTVRSVSGIKVVDVSPTPTGDAEGAPCIDAEGRLIGLASRADDSLEPSRLVLLGDRLLPLLQEARQKMSAVQSSVVSPPPPAGRAVAGQEERPARPTTGPTTAESETDRRRREGAETFEQAVSRLAYRQDDVARLQSRYDTECVGIYVPIVMVPGAPWPYPGGLVIEKSELPECKALQQQIDEQADSFRRAVAEAEEQARRAGVYPGTIRDIKRARGLGSSR